MNTIQRFVSLELFTGFVHLFHVQISKNFKHFQGQILSIFNEFQLVLIALADLRQPNLVVYKIVLIYFT